MELGKWVCVFNRDREVWEIWASYDSGELYEIRAEVKGDRAFMDLYMKLEDNIAPMVPKRASVTTLISEELDTCTQR